MNGWMTECMGECIDGWMDESMHSVCPGMNESRDEKEDQITCRKKKWWRWKESRVISIYTEMSAAQ